MFSYIKHYAFLYTVYLFWSTTMTTPTTGTSPKTIQPFDEYDPREQKWIWNYLETNSMIYDRLDATFPTQKPYDMNTFIQNGKLTRIIQNLPEAFNFDSVILPAMKNSLVPEVSLKWIDKDNHRLLIWAIHHIDPASPSLHLRSLDNNRPMISSQTGTHAVNRHEEIIHRVDIWPKNIAEKNDFLLTKKDEWINHKTPDKLIKWLDQKNEGQLVWAWEYLKKQGEDMPISTPFDAIEYHAAVLASLDEMSYGYPSDKKLFMDQMKRTWSQKKFRDSGKAKKPYNLPLTIQTKKKLEWLAENSGQKPSEILEQLIQESHKKATENK